MNLRSVVAAGARGHPPGWLCDNLCYETMMGSVAYGVSSDSSDMDFFRAYIETADGHRTVVTEERGTPTTDPPAWLGTRVSLAPWVGQTIRIVFEAADRGPASTVEAAVDDVKVWRP